MQRLSGGKLINMDVWKINENTDVRERKQGRGAGVRRDVPCSWGSEEA